MQTHAVSWHLSRSRYVEVLWWEQCIKLYMHTEHVQCTCTVYMYTHIHVHDLYVTWINNMYAQLCYMLKVATWQGHMFTCLCWLTLYIIYVPACILYIVASCRKSVYIWFLVAFSVSCSCIEHVIYCCKHGLHTTPMYIHLCWICIELTE